MGGGSLSPNFKTGQSDRSVFNFEIWNKIKEESTVEASGEDEETHDNDSDQSDESRTHTVQGVKVFF